MNYDISSKFEINIATMTGQDVTDMRDAPSFILKNRCAALVVKPEYVAASIASRGSMGPVPPFRIYIKIDDFKSFGLDKLKMIPRDAFSADGFDITFTPDRSQKETENEIKSIKEFVSAMNQLAEVRFSLDSRIHDLKCVKSCAEAVKQQPVMIRMGTDTEKLFYTDEMIETVKEIVKPKIKLCGQVTLKTVEENKAAKYDVSLNQARLILRQAEKRYAKPA
jgi:hypothetical protein